MGAPFFLVTNKLRSATVLSEDTITDFDFENALDGKTSTQAGFAAGASRVVVLDFGTAQTVSHIAYAAHNLTGATILIESSTDNSSYTTRLSTTAIAGVNTHEFTSFNERYFRLTLSGLAGNTYVSDFFAGEAIELPHGMPFGFIPPELADEDEIDVNMTGNGSTVGITVNSRPKRISVNMRDYLATWFDTNWLTLINGLKLYPGYFLWGESKRAMFCTIDKKAPKPSYTNHLYMSAKLDLEGFVE